MSRTKLACTHCNQPDTLGGLCNDCQTHWHNAHSVQDCHDARNIRSFPPINPPTPDQAPMPAPPADELPVERPPAVFSLPIDSQSTQLLLQHAATAAATLTDLLGDLKNHIHQLAAERNALYDLSLCLIMVQSEPARRREIADHMAEDHFDALIYLLPNLPPIFAPRIRTSEKQ